MINTWQTTLKKIEKKVAAKRAAYQEAVAVVNNCWEALRRSEELYAAAQEAQEVLQQVAETIQERAHRRISMVVSKCLETVFEDPYEFVIRFEKKRGKTEAVILFLRDGMEIDPLTASGGGAVDVAAFALRTACLALSRPAPRKLVVLDEPFKFVSAQYRENVKLMLEKLAEDMGFQIVMVTHINELVTGNVIEI